LGADPRCRPSTYTAYAEATSTVAAPAAICYGQPIHGSDRGGLRTGDFNCAGRGQGLYGVPGHDVTLIRERLGEWPLVGFFGNGEFAPVGTTNFFHNYTGVLVVFPQP